jgi:hypothetical protein
VAANHIKLSESVDAVIGRLRVPADKDRDFIMRVSGATLDSTAIFVEVVPRGVVAELCLCSSDFKVKFEVRSPRGVRRLTKIVDRKMCVGRLPCDDFPDLVGDLVGRVRSQSGEVRELRTDECFCAVCSAEDSIELSERPFRSCTFEVCHEVCRDSYEKVVGSLRTEEIALGETIGAVMQWVRPALASNRDFVMRVCGEVLNNDAQFVAVVRRGVVVELTQLGREFRIVLPNGRSVRERFGNEAMIQDIQFGVHRTFKDEGISIEQIEIKGHNDAEQLFADHDSRFRLEVLCKAKS